MKDMMDIGCSPMDCDLCYYTFHKNVINMARYIDSSVILFFSTIDNFFNKKMNYIILPNNTKLWCLTLTKL